MPNKTNRINKPKKNILVTNTRHQTKKYSMKVSKSSNSKMNRNHMNKIKRINMSVTLPLIKKLLIN